MAPTGPGPSSATARFDALKIPASATLEELRLTLSRHIGKTVHIHRIDDRDEPVAPGGHGLWHVDEHAVRLFVYLHNAASVIIHDLAHLACGHITHPCEQISTITFTEHQETEASALAALIVTAADPTDWVTTR